MRRNNDHMREEGADKKGREDLKFESANPFISELQDVVHCHRPKHSLTKELFCCNGSMDRSKPFAFLFPVLPIYLSLFAVFLCLSHGII